MGNLHVIKQDHILKLGGIAHNAVISHQGGSPDKCGRPDLSAVTDDAGAADIGRLIIKIGILCDPDVLCRMVILVLRKGLSDLQNQVLDPGQRLPGILELTQIVCGQSMIQII